jgi:CDP-diacylglycerol---serine O-phosphatidyltransferase
VLTIGTVCYLACLPLGVLSYRRYQRKDLAAANAVQGGADAAVRARAQGEAPPLSPGPAEPPPDRPVRLN